MLGIVHNASFMKKKHSVLPNIFIFYTSIKYIDTCTHKYFDVFLINTKIKCNMHIKKFTDSKLFTIDKLL